MTIIDNIHQKISNLYDQIEKVTKKSPLTIIVYSVALKALSVFACIFSSVLGLSAFLFSLIFDMAIITNFDKICKTIEKKFLDMTKGAF